jgi:putative iron-dependent peroxidase
MFIGNPPGNYDRILDFSTPITGTLFFVPTADFLEDPPPLPGIARSDAGVLHPNPTPVATAGTRSPEADGSLGIGGLRDLTQSGNRSPY